MRNKKQQFEAKVRKLCQQISAEQDRLKALGQQMFDLVKQREALVEPGRRGRKSMPQEERLQVSERMRKYWAMRKALTKAIATGESKVVNFEPSEAVDARWIDTMVRDKDVCVVIQAKYVKQSDWVKWELDAAQ